MTRGEAQEILLLYRPGTQDGEDPQIATAIDFATRDPQLTRWFRQHQAFQAAMGLKFRQIEIPEHLRIALLTRSRLFVPRRFFRQTPVWLAVAAAVVLFAAGLIAVWLKPQVPDRFHNYRELMVSKVLRGYAMEWRTKDMRQLRAFAEAKNRLDDFELTTGLQHLELVGGDVFPWRNNAVTLVCFSRADRQMVFLFVFKKAAVKDPPPEKPIQVKVGELLTASWTLSNQIYLLAGPDDPTFARYLPAY